MTKTAVPSGTPHARSTFRNPVFRECRASSVPRDGSLPMSREMWVSADQAAEMLGRNRRFVYELGYNGSVLACKIGQASLFYRFDIEKVRDWCARRREEEEEALRAAEEVRIREERLEALKAAMAERSTPMAIPSPENGLENAELLPVPGHGSTVTREEFEEFKRDVICAINMLADSFSGDKKKPRQMILQGLFTVDIKKEKHRAQ
ncbi:MAG: helix-turn-helix domain-containing protein [Thermoguttaceae bacterium]|jgi:hypothetical protein